MTFNPSIRAEYLFQELDRWVEKMEDLDYDLDNILDAMCEYLDVCEDIYFAGK